MEVKIIKECGYEEAMLGISLSFNSDIGRMSERAEKLAPLDLGHNKFLESIVVWMDIDAPRYWWSQFDTYRIGVTKQSESTMHTLTKRSLTQDDFEDPIHPTILGIINDYIDNGDLISAKNNLPEGFLQRRVVCTNYKSLRGVVLQRHAHRLPQWQKFCSALASQIERPTLLYNF